MTRIPDDQTFIRKALGMPPVDYHVNRKSRPHLRCGICQEPFEAGEQTAYLDDERVHPECAEDAA